LAPPIVAHALFCNLFSFQDSKVNNNKKDNEGEINYSSITLSVRIYPPPYICRAAEKFEEMGDRKKEP